MSDGIDPLAPPAAEQAPAPTSVSADEVLYRRLRNEDNVVALVNGQPKVTAQAFADREQKPSVDLATLCAPLGGASWTQEGEDNGVARLITRDVRAIDPIVGTMLRPPPIPPNTKKEVQVPHRVDVHPCPVANAPPARDNPAHAEIRPRPDWCSKNVFRRLLERLERIAHIEIAPKSHRGE